MKQINELIKEIFVKWLALKVEQNISQDGEDSKMLIEAFKMSGMNNSSLDFTKQKFLFSQSLNEIKTFKEIKTFLIVNSQNDANFNGLFTNDVTEASVESIWNNLLTSGKDLNDILFELKKVAIMTEGVKVYEFLENLMAKLGSDEVIANLEVEDSIYLTTTKTTSIIENVISLMDKATLSILADQIDILTNSHDLVKMLEAGQIVKKYYVDNQVHSMIEKAQSMEVSETDLSSGEIGTMIKIVKEIGELTDILDIMAIVVEQLESQN